MSVDSSPAAEPIRLVAIDLDGTLLDDRKQVSPQTVAALAEVVERGVRVIIASARPPRSVRHIYAALKLQTWQINYNGALIWDEPAKRTVFHRPLPGMVVRQIVEQARRIYPGVQVSCELMDRWYTDRRDDEHTTETGRMFAPDVVAPLESFWDVSMTKVLLLGKPAGIDELEANLEMVFEKDMCLVRADPDLIQIMDKQVGKAPALKMVADHYGVSAKQILAIGDAPNDLGMLRFAGASVAMDNAHPAVKQAAQWIAPSNNDHGVHAALVRYGLCS
jgi:5-amino-6-(5-phospho-D-ribitylamino)uracil phosphatase